MPDKEIIPALLVKTKREAQDRLSVLGSIAPWVQLDVMDGHFVPNTSWHDVVEFGEIETDVSVELHLMVRDPETVIRAWSLERRCHRAIWHIEIPVDHTRLIQLCRALRWECGLAISPRTAIPAVAPYLGMIDEILVLGVEPGFSSQPILPATFDRLEHIKRLAPNILIGLDGGVTLENAESLLNAGVNRLCAASAIFKAEQPTQALLALQRYVRNR